MSGKLPSNQQDEGVINGLVELKVRSSVLEQSHNTQNDPRWAIYRQPLTPEAPNDTMFKTSSSYCSVWASDMKPIEAIYCSTPHSGVELQGTASSAQSLGSLEFQLKRYLKHVHIGPYQALPQKWRDLKTELEQRGEIIGSHSHEIYGHHCDDTSKLETTILIGLEG